MFALDNPIWCSLQTRHHALARGDDSVRRYPSDVAPFLAVPHDDMDVGAALGALVPDGDAAYLLGPVPRVPDGFRLHAYDALAQMVCDAALPQPDGPPIVPLDATHRDDVLALTALVYPHYFRPRTMEMGRYVGIYRQGRLAAMAGERLGSDTHQEISAICTHPDFTGLGYARQLLAFLTNATLERGRTPFLHVSHENVRAKQLYERMGYRLHQNIAFFALRRG